jgi:hypothetical protein
MRGVNSFHGTIPVAFACNLESQMPRSHKFAQKLFGWSFCLGVTEKVIDNMSKMARKYEKSEQQVVLGLPEVEW